VCFGGVLYDLSWVVECVFFCVGGMVWGVCVMG